MFRGAGKGVWRLKQKLGGKGHASSAPELDADIGPGHTCSPVLPGENP
jgi:hypothetical protein